MGDVGRHLRNHGYLHAPLHAGRIRVHQFGALTYVAAHALVLHLRTREVQFHGIASGLLGHPGQGLPLLLRLSHDAGHHHLCGEVVLQSAQDVEVHLHGVLAQLLHIAEAVEIAVGGVGVHCVKSWRHLFDLLHADGLVEHACPSGPEGTGHHLVVGAYGR